MNNAGVPLDTSYFEASLSLWLKDYMDMDLCFFFENPLQKLFSLLVFLFMFFLFRGVVIAEFVGRRGGGGGRLEIGPTGVLARMGCTHSTASSFLLFLALPM